MSASTVTRLKLKGEFTNRPASGKIRQVLIEAGLWPSDGEAAAALGILAIPDPVHTQIKRAELAKKIEEERRLKMVNDQAASILLSVEDVKSRIGSAGVLLRTGVDGARRSLEAVACDGCRKAVITEFDGAMGATIGAVARALKGE